MKTIVKGEEEKPKPLNLANAKSSNAVPFSGDPKCKVCVLDKAKGGCYQHRTNSRPTPEQKSALATMFEKPKPVEWKRDARGVRYIGPEQPKPDNGKAFKPGEYERKMKAIKAKSQAAKNEAHSEDEVDDLVDVGSALSSKMKEHKAKKMKAEKPTPKTKKSEARGKKASNKKAKAKAKKAKGGK